MKRWLVITPQYDYVEPVLDDGSGPVCQTCDVVDIEAETSRDAVALAVKLMLEDQTRYEWVHMQRSDNMCPYTGIKAEPFDPDWLEE